MMTETVVTVENASPNNNAAKSSDSSRSGSWLKLHPEYFKTQPGILKIAQLIFGILCMALASPALLGGTHWFLFAATISFIGSLVWSCVYLLGIREALNLPIDWLLSELINTGIATVLYAIGFLVQIIVWISPPLIIASYRGVNITAGVFGIFNTIAYGLGAMLLHKEWQSSRTN
ncbi:hypothetical protein Trydic_g11300 [Trypoxylus dichotomus]